MYSKLIRTGAIMLALLAASAASHAADAYRPIYKSPPPLMIPDYNWTGFYLGANGGYGAGPSNNAKGWVAGGTVGYNLQVGHVVLGFEGDYDWTNMTGNTTAGVCAASVSGCRTTVPWLATARGRVGYAFDRIMPYVTGGLAYGNLKAESDFGSDSENQPGYALGGGVEYAFGDRWSTKIEYLYVSLSDSDCAAPCGSPAVPATVRFTENFFRFGLNYRFNGPAPLGN